MNVKGRCEDCVKPSFLLHSVLLSISLFTDLQLDSVAKWRAPPTRTTNLRIDWTPKLPRGFWMVSLEVLEKQRHGLCCAWEMYVDTNASSSKCPYTRVTIHSGSDGLCGLPGFRLIRPTDSKSFENQVGAVSIAIQLCVSCDILGYSLHVILFDTGHAYICTLQE